MFCAVLMPAYTLGQREVIWQHGLNGEEERGKNKPETKGDFWKDYAVQFERERQMNSTFKPVTTKLGVPAMAEELVRETSSVSGPQTIGIGHSMGGLALREIVAETAPEHIGGLITVGSPLSGAQIADGIIRGDASALVGEAARQIGKGPAREFLPPGFIIVTSSIGVFTAERLWKIIEEYIDDILNNDFTPQTVADLSVRGNYMRRARNYSITMPKISIYGAENSPVQYRLVSSYGRHDDGKIPRKISEAQAVYLSYVIKNSIQFASPLMLWRASGWRDGVLSLTVVVGILI